MQVVSITSPMVGNSDFVKAFQPLEQEGRLCYLRIVNDDDVVPKDVYYYTSLVVPTLPTMSATVDSSPGVASSSYRHCGMEVLCLTKDAIVFNEFI